MLCNRKSDENDHLGLPLFEETSICAFLSGLPPQGRALEANRCPWEAALPVRSPGFFGDLRHLTRNGGTLKMDGFCERENPMKNGRLWFKEWSIMVNYG